MKYDLQGVIKPITKLKATINVSTTTPESGAITAGYLIPSYTVAKGIAGYMEISTESSESEV